MALIKWGLDDEEEKKDSPFSANPIQSVQNGAWQPSQDTADDSNTDQNQPYLISDQKQAVDDQLAQRREAEAAAEAARQAEISRVATESENARKIESNNAIKEAEFKAAKEDTGWKKYYDDNFKKESDGLDFWGRLLDNGQASKRAETNARSQYTNELLTQAYDDNGNTLDQTAADKARALAGYNSAVASNNSKESQALSNAIGASSSNPDEDFWGRVKSTANVIKNMSIYDGIAGVDDSTRFGINDVSRFVGGLAQGFGTMPIVGAKELVEAGTGRGTDAQTGLEDELTLGERAGRGISGALNVVTPFVGGSGKLLESLTAKVGSGVATAAEKTLLRELTTKILFPAIEQGGIGATQAGAEYFGNGNTLVDENGNLDNAKLLEFARQTGTAGAMGFGGGAVMAGAGYGINKLRNKNMPKLTPDELADIETRATNAGEAQLSSVRRMNDGSQIDLKALEEGKFTPLDDTADLTPIADETTILDQPTQDTNISFEKKLNESDLGQPSNLFDNMDATPIIDTPAPVADNLTPNIDTSTPVETSVDPTIDQKSNVAKSVDTPVTPVGDVTPVRADTTPVVADGIPQTDKVMPVSNDPNMPVVKSEEVRQLQNAKAGKTQAEEAAINQELKQIKDNTPAMEEPTNGKLTPDQVAQRLMPKLADNSDMKNRIASVVGVGKDSALPIRDILLEGKVKPDQAERVATHFDNLEKQLQEYNKLEELNQKAYAEGGTDALSPEVSRDRSRIARDMGTTTRRLVAEINRIDGSRSFKTRIVNSVTDLIGVRNASVLSSAGLIERNVMQELTANAKLFAKNPIKMVKSTFNNGNILKDTAKAELSHWKDAPRNPIEAIKYVVGNTYRTAMIPTTALANTRRGAVRDELTRWAYKELEGRNLSSKEAHKLAGTAGNEMEALVNTFIGVDNGMTSRGQATEALKSWKEYIRTGDDAAKNEFLKRVETHSSLADQMIAGLSKDDEVKARGLMAIKNLVFPFVRTATNLMKTAVKQDLNPFAKSLLDEIRVDQRSGTANAVNLIKSKLVDYGIMGGAAALATSGVLVYSNGDDVDKPRGWSVKTGENTYIPVRATSLELPIAMAGTAQAMASDIAAGKAQDWKYYAGMITGSLPYIDQMNTTTGAVDSLVNGEDAGYAAKSYAVNMAKSFVPFSNNGIQPYVAGKKGESLNAKTVYDDNMFTWFKNTVQKAYDPNFYNSLDDSRDNAGRVRTIDNQGVVSNKTINDKNIKNLIKRIPQP